MFLFQVCPIKMTKHQRIDFYSMALFETLKRSSLRKKTFNGQKYKLKKCSKIVNFTYKQIYLLFQYFCKKKVEYYCLTFQKHQLLTKLLLCNKKQSDINLVEVAIVQQKNYQIIRTISHKKCLLHPCDAWAYLSCVGFLIVPLLQFVKCVCVFVRKPPEYD